MNIVITVPHAICVGDNKHHFCDSTAVMNAGILYNLITRLTDNKVYMYTADTWRYECDENRSPCRDKPFRRLIDSKINSKSILLDIHSFPKYGFSSVSYPDDSDIVLLYLGSIDTYTQSLCDRLKRNNVNVRALPGSNKNDILYTSALKIFYGILIEFNESLTLEESSVICGIITEWVINVRDT